MPGQPRMDVLDCFVPKTRKAPNGCLEWTGCLDRYGYGRFHRGLLAHRMAYELFVGPIPDGLFVLHHCDNPKCVSIAHLFLGTQRDNLLDMDEKGRRVSARGERIRQSKLTEADIREIRLRNSNGESLRSLGRSFGVSNVCIFNITKRNTWSHIP